MRFIRLRTIDPQNETVYCLQEVDNKEVYESVISKPECMSKKSETAFATWCSKRKVNFMDMPFTRKRSKESNRRYRKLYVMKNEYRGNILLILLKKYHYLFSVFKVYCKSHHYFYSTLSKLRKFFKRTRMYYH